MKVGANIDATLPQELPRIVRISTPDHALGFSIQLCDGTFDEMALRPTWNHRLDISNRIEISAGQYLGATESPLVVQGGVTDDNIRMLAEIPHLESVVIGDHSLTVTGWACLAEITALRKLAVRAPTVRKYQTDDLAVLGRLHRLEYLDIRGLVINENVMASIAGLTELRELRLAFGRTSDNSGLLRQLAGMTKLRRLVASGWTDHGWGEALTGLNELEELDVQIQHLTDGFVRAASKVLRIRRLSLHWGLGESGQPTISDAAFRSLAALSRLEELEISGAILSYSGVFEVFAGRPLRSLLLSRCQLSGESLRELANLQTLQRLVFTACESITDADVRLLSEIPGIRELSINRCPNISGRWLDELAIEGPPLSIRRWMWPGGPTDDDYNRAARTNPRIRLIQP